MPCRRIGRSTSTTPWSKSISITRSATTHSRPIETCWKEEIVHSWPSTVLAPISHTPSCTRSFVPCPSHDQRPSRSTAPRPISSLTPGPTKHSPSVCNRRPQRSFSHAQRAISRPYFALSIPRPRRKRTSPSGPPCSGAGTPWTGGAAAGRLTVAMRGDPSADYAAPPMADSLAERLLAGDKRALARGISLVEDDDPEGWALVKEIYPHTGSAAVVGFTGPPGAGKSTLIGALIRHRRKRDRQVAVLSIDPSSPFRGGALLGDRIRLSEHFLDPGVFIRSMATRGALGGLAEAALQTALLMDAAGKDDVFLETVGVGQAEVDVIDHADSVVLVLIPGSGDSIQALKAGVMEIPDIIVVNKADHAMADTMVRQVRSVLSLAPKEGRRVQIVKTEAVRAEGIDKLADALEQHRSRIAEEGTLDERRRRNLLNEVLALAGARLRAALAAGVHEDATVQELLDAVVARRMDPASAAREILAGGVVSELRFERLTPRFETATVGREA